MTNKTNALAEDIKRLRVIPPEQQTVATMMRLMSINDQLLEVIAEQEDFIKNATACRGVVCSRCINDFSNSLASTKELTELVRGENEKKRYI